MVSSMKRNLIIAVLMLALLGTSATVFAATYTNSKTFNLAMPHLNQNGTAASAKKTTGQSYGKVTVTMIGGGSSGLNCWLRSKKSNGDWDPLNSKYRSFTKKGTKTVYYTNSSTGYKIPHHKGASVQLRLENRTTTQAIRDNVRGTVWFN